MKTAGVIELLYCVQQKRRILNDLHVFTEKRKISRIVDLQFYDV